MSSVKGYEGSATKSIDYNRSSSKRLYEFVFKIVLIIAIQIDHDEMEVSSFDHYETNGTKITNLLTNEDFLENLHHKIKS